MDTDRTNCVQISWGSRRCIRRLIFFLILCLALVSGTPAGAETGSPTTPSHESDIGLNEVTEGSLLFKTEEAGRYIPAPTVKTEVRISVTGPIARATVRQEFLNPSKTWAEGIYVFPLPETAAVDHLRMHVGERIIEGIIKERAEAKKTYETAKREGKRTSLVEQERPNIFTTSVANIAPGDRIIVEIEYQETLRMDQHRFQLRFPMVVGPRYIPGTPMIIEDHAQGTGWAVNTDRVPDASRITPPVQHPDHGPMNPLSLTIDLAPGFPLGKVESPSHPILIIPQADGRRTITLREDAVPADRDFLLTWEPATGLPPTAHLFTEQQGEETYALLMVTPSPLSAGPSVLLPREVMFVIDTSGSMAGQSIEQAKAALQLALSRLTAQDRFNIIQFNSVTRVLFAEPQPVRPETLRKATHYVDAMVANGGTEILPALKQALHAPSESGRLRQIIFLTDGQIGNEDELFSLIHRDLGDSRLFTIGIGSAPNSHFMRNAARFGRGTFTHIGNTAEVTAAMNGLFRKLERPVVTDIRVDLHGSDTAESFPNPIPDLYEGEPVVVAIKSRSAVDRVTVRAQIGDEPWTEMLAAADAPPRQGLSVYWARQKIAALMDRLAQGHRESETRQAVLDLAVRHHLVSKYTSLVAVDVTPARPLDKSWHSQAIKTNLPVGQDYAAIFGLPQKTATDAELRIVIGLIILLTTWMVCRFRRRCACS